MAETSYPAPLTSGAGRSFENLVKLLNGIGSLWILALLILINADVFGRNLMHAPISGVVEMVEISMIAIVFLQLGDATRVGRLTRSDGFFGIILQRRPRIGHAMGAAFDFLGALFMFFILYGSWPSLVEAWVLDDYVGNEGVFTAPRWPMLFILIFGSLITLLLFLTFVGRHLRAYRAAGGPEGKAI